MPIETPPNSNLRTTLHVATIVLIAASSTYLLTRALGSVGTTTTVLSVPAFLLLSIAFWQVKSDGLHAAFLWLHRGLTLILAFYVVTAYPGYSEFSHPDSKELIELLSFLPWIATIGAAIALSRPIFAIVPAVCVLASKSATQTIHGLPTLSYTDYLPLVELSIFLSASLAITYALSLIAPRISRWLKIPTPPTDFSIMLFLSALAIHFANYFYSALAKISMDGGPTDWVLTSQTHYLTEAASMLGLLPLAPGPEFVAAAHQLLGEWIVLSNFLVFVTQLLAIVAFYRIRFALLLTLWFDITHIMIFLATGIFFWKWILLNALFVVGLSKLANWQMLPMQRWTLILMIPAANVFFFSATLAWYDSPGLLRHQVVAVTNDNQRIPVPSNFFLDASVTFAQNRLGTPSGHFPTSTWGGTQSHKIRDAAFNDCEFADQPVVRPLDQSLLSPIIGRYHNYVMANLDSYGRFRFDFYPHHILSNRFAFKRFYELDLRSVKKYEYLVESICLDGDITTTNDRVVKRDIFEIPLTP